MDTDTKRSIDKAALRTSEIYANNHTQTNPLLTEPVLSVRSDRIQPDTAGVDPVILLALIV